MKIFKLLLPILILVFTECSTGINSAKDNKKVETQKPVEKKEIKYSAVSLKNENLDSFKQKYTTEQLAIILAVNRIDESHLNRIDTIIIPDDLEAGLTQYSPFPVSLSFLSKIKKMIFFPTQPNLLLFIIQAYWFTGVLLIWA